MSHDKRYGQSGRGVENEVRTMRGCQVLVGCLEDLAFAYVRWEVTGRFSAKDCPKGMGSDGLGLKTDTS